MSSFELLTPKDIEGMPEGNELRIFIGIQGKQGTGKTELMETVKRHIQSECHRFFTARFEETIYKGMPTEFMILEEET